MAGIFKAPGTFAITPHKVSVCILLQIYAPPAQISVPFPFSSVSHHNRLGVYLIALTKSFDDILEPTLDELIAQLREIGGLLNDWLIDHLTRRLSSLSSPDDLFNLFNELGGIFGGAESGVVQDDQIALDPNSNLGIFLRFCILAFNLLAFEGVCHLLSNIGIYCKESLSSCQTYELPQLTTSNELEGLMDYENKEILMFDKVNEEIEARKKARERIPFHMHVPYTYYGFIEDIEVSPSVKFKHGDKARESSLFSHSSKCALKGVGPDDGAFLRTNWQTQGYLREQANAMEKRGRLCHLNAFKSNLKKLHKLAPELHRVHFLHYLTNLYHYDYPAALESLLCYFDYSAGTEGFDLVPPSGGSNYGRYEIGLLCLGMMHFHFGHPRQGLEVLTEAVSVSQQHNNDACLAYTLAAICNFLSDFGISRTCGILGSSFSLANSSVSFRTIQQQLYVLLRRSLKRAESLKLKSLMASNYLAMAKFDLMHVQRPLLYFGPKACMKLKTCPIDVCKELRSSYCLVSEFCTENTVMTTDGVLSTAWMKNLQKPMRSLVLSQENESGSSYDAFPFCAPPNSLPGSLVQLVGSSYLLRATAWELYGSASLARINALIYATCFADMPSSDMALAYSKLIQHLATYKGYKEAFRALNIAEEKFLSISKPQILLIKLQLLHERAMHRGCLKLAQQLCHELEALASPVKGVDMEVKVEAGIRHARTLLAASQVSQAATVAHSLFCMCYKFNLQVENARVLLLLAEIHKKSGNAVLGLPYALASLSFCQSFNLDLLKASASLTLAELWLSLGANHSKRALTLVHGALPMIIGHGGLEICARAYIAEAKCYLADPGFSVSEDHGLVLSPLKNAADTLELLEYHELAAEAYYLMAIVYDKLGELEEREAAASSFKKHLMILENPHHEEDPLFHVL